ncbi:MAG TPA: hypothetical protein VD866_19820 [Urbifossiella sp.]|nr:hypothetical protein [Urbifossiella sp.]
MRRFPRLFLAAVFALPVAVGGCGNSESKTNPELKVPDVPAGGRSQPMDKGVKKT